ncbi:glycosyltransferase family 4 protein [Algoriphagus chordae]|uniref:Glycosyltransferase involved in cell wall biosynthesis n=1 Tax=Algoriphagus chordae TaxID=237019 RepID=A0A2W7RAP8_9BACT|nr:glycosyltransferase family 4 protein [Algoriphagus chordae]PZX47675.1 glycosyltransferase involved in cell wall biosynthesis [Algoriphagus chordae]
MRILQLIDTLNPGGAERMAVNLANTFSEVGIENQLVVSRNQGDLGNLVQDQATLFLLEKKKTTDWKAFRKLLSLVDQFKPDVVHAHGTSVYWGAALKLFRPKVKLIWHDHLGISEEVIRNNPRTELKWIASKIDFLITANESTRAYWIELGLKPQNLIEYLPNFPYLVTSSKVKPTLFTFLHLANYRTEKGQKNIVEAVKILKEKRDDFKVRLVGMAIDQTWERAVAEKVSSTSLSKFISVEGPVSNVAELLSEVHAGLVASDREGLPVALLEYGLAALPVVSTAVGQCPEVLGNGDYGILVPAADCKALADGMDELLSNPEKALKMGKSFQKHVKDNYGSSQFMKGYNDILFLLTQVNLSSN